MKFKIMINGSVLCIKRKKEFLSCIEGDTCKNKILVYHTIDAHLYMREGFSTLFHFKMDPPLFLDFFKWTLIIKL